MDPARGRSDEDATPQLLKLMEGIGVSNEECLQVLEDDAAFKLVSLLLNAVETGEASLAETTAAADIADILESFGGSANDTVQSLQSQIEVLSLRSQEHDNSRFARKVQQKERLSIVEMSLRKDLHFTELMCQSVEKDVEPEKRELLILLSEFTEVVEELERNFTAMAAALEDVGSETSLQSLLSQMWKQSDDFVEFVQQFISGSCNSLEIQDSNSSVLWKRRLASMKEISRLQSVFMLTEMEHVDAVTALEQLRAAQETATKQLLLLQSGRLPPLDSGSFEADVVAKQSEITSLHTQASKLRDGHLAKLLSALKEFEGLSIIASELRLTAAANAKILGNHTLAASLLEDHRTCMRLVQGAVGHELQQHRALDEVRAAAQEQLAQAGRDAPRLIASTAEHFAASGGLPAGMGDSVAVAAQPAMHGTLFPCSACPPDEVLSLYVALGGTEDALSAGWIADSDVCARAEQLGRERAQAEAAGEELRREMWAESRRLAAHSDAMLRCWQQGSSEGEGGQLVTTPVEVGEAMAELGAVRERLDERLQAVQRRREEPRHPLPSFFVDFFLRPELLTPLRV